MDLNIPLPVIGIVHTSYTELEATPIQAGLNQAERGTIEIADRYQEGLDGLAEFDYAWLVTWLLPEIPLSRQSAAMQRAAEAAGEGTGPTVESTAGADVADADVRTNGAGPTQRTGDDETPVTGEGAGRAR